MLDKVQRWLLLGFVFLFPVFFLPITQDFYTTNKFYLACFVILVCLVLSVVKFLLSKKVTVNRHELQIPLFLFITALGASLVISSPNRLDALVAPMTGYLVFVAFALLAILLRDRRMGKEALKFSFYGAAFLSFITVVFFVNPLSSVPLPASLAFLKTSAFTPMGLPFEAAVFLSFFLLYGAMGLYRGLRAKAKIGSLAGQGFLTMLVALALLLSVYRVISPIDKAESFMPPAMTTWNAAVETLKTGKTALFGVGIGNFEAAFTRGKAPEYNTNTYWTYNFNRGSSMLLHVWAEAGIVGLVSLIFLLGLLLRWAVLEKGKGHSKFIALLTIFGVIAAVILPPSLPLFMILALVLSVAKNQEGEEEAEKGYALNLKAEHDNREVYWIALAGGAFVLLAATTFFLGKTYASELQFKQAGNAILANDTKKAFEGDQAAILSAPFIERYHIGYSQLNLLVANGLFKNIVKSGTKKLSDAQRTMISQTVQEAIVQAKVAVTLNPQKTSNWENLAVIYSNLIGVAQGSDQWAISAYQQAIALDQSNPRLRFGLGSIYYGAGDYKTAQEFFTQAAQLKPDWTNAFYNLAWAYYKDNQLEKAVAAMQIVLSQTKPTENNYKKVKKELDQFKQNAENASKEKLDNLEVPSDANTVISPKLDLPPQASPPAGLRLTPTPSDNPSATQSAQMINVALINTTSVSGLTKTVEDELRAKGAPSFSVMYRGNSKEKYDTTLVVDVKGTHKKDAATFASLLHGTVGSFPENETPVQADLAIFVTQEPAQ